MCAEGLGFSSVAERVARNVCAWGMGEEILFTVAENSIFKMGSSEELKQAI